MNLAEYFTFAQRWAVGLKRAVDEVNQGLQKVGSWSWFGSLTTQDTQKFITAQKEFPSPGYYTIKFGVFGDIPTGGSPPQPEAIITWSVGGQQITRRISVQSGTSISGTAEAVSIRVVDNTDTIGAVNNYDVAIEIVPGVRPDTDFPPILRNKLNGTISFVDIAAGTGLAFNLPREDGPISVMCVCWTAGANTGFNIASNIPLVTTGEMQLIQADSRGTAGFPLSSHDVAIDRFFIPLHPGATRVQLFNSSAGTTYRCVMIFGIDG